MNEIEKQILKNQEAILNTVNRIMTMGNQAKEDSGSMQQDNILRYDETRDLISPKNLEEEPCCEMPERELGTHLTHCYQGEYLTTCKYGDTHCPARNDALSKKNGEKKNE